MYVPLYLRVKAISRHGDRAYMAEYHKRCVDRVCTPDPPIIRAESVFFDRYVKARAKKEIITKYRTKIDQSGDEA